MNRTRKQQLLHKYLLNQCDDEEARQVMTLLSQPTDDPELEALMEEAWEKAVGEITLQEDHSQALWKGIKSRTTEKETKKGRQKTMFPYWRVAASVVFAIGLGILVYQLLPSAKESQRARQFVETSTGEGRSTQIQLADGSTVYLNENSSLRYAEHFGEDKVREVLLEGEAYFTVTKNPAKPFVVRTRESRIRVLGTAFNVKEIEKDTLVLVAVSEGKVAFQAADQPDTGIHLTAGQVALLRGSQTIERLPTSVDNHLSWFSRHLVFRQTSLPAVVQQLEYLYETDIILQDDALQTLSFTGKLDRDPLPVVLKQIALALDLQYKQENNVFVLMQR